jgi:hypothetical protein
MAPEVFLDAARFEKGLARFAQPEITSPYRIDLAGMAATSRQAQYLRSRRGAPV